MYRAPTDEIAFTLKHVAGLSTAIAMGHFGDLGEDLVDAILGEAGRFASEEIAPAAGMGDRHGTPLADGAVTMPPGWKDLYRRWIDGGWNALSGPQDYGGQALPTMLSVAAFEMWNSGSMAFAIGPTLTVGAVEALVRHGSPDLQALYLEKLVSGEWTGTMNLTEPQAGSDLNALKARAEPAGDGTYRLFGQKIFITYGEHDLTENIVHMVLARLPDAPAGTRGISLFLVPKFLPGGNDGLGARNDVFCAGVEKKLGIHGSPTCAMIYGDGKYGRSPGAVGWLVGEENRGLACMFTMMNNARLMVGIQGVAIAEAAYQKALAYACERRQGRAPAWTGKGMSPIVEHPDVQRMLLTMKALTQGARSIAYSCAHAIDMARVTRGEVAERWQERANLLTPLAKAFPTDIGVEVASLGIQVHGGMGFIEETGAAALLRDARIAPIYEGTNGIQAIDLVTRKLPMANGEAIASYLRELRAIAEEAGRSNRPEIVSATGHLSDALDDAEATSRFLAEAVRDGDMQAALAGATPFLRLLSLAASGAYLAKAALLDDAEENARAALYAFAATNLLGETVTLRRAVEDGGRAIAAASAALSV